MIRPAGAQVFGIDVDVVCFDNAVYYVPLYGANRYVSNQIRNKQYAEVQLHQLVGKVGATYEGSMIHAGTFFGDMLPSFSNKINGTVYAFEPVLENYLLARAASEVNQLENVLLLHAGLGTAPGITLVRTGDEQKHRAGGSKVNVGDIPEGVRTQTISLVSIDQFSIDDLVMIQLDVEGFEHHVLQGALKSIAAHHPVVVVEDQRKECAEVLTEFGYRDYGLVSTNTLYLTEDRARELGYA